MPYGTAAGMPNYRHAEPFAQLKNIKDFYAEHSHFPTVYFKLFLTGAATGIFWGSFWTFIRPISGFSAQKLMLTAGDRDWSGRLGR
jgi:hypothetical protein